MNPPLHSVGLFALVPGLLVGSLLGSARVAGAVSEAGLRPWISMRFPGVAWISTEDLSRWRAGEHAPPPVLLDARAAEEFEVSHLRDARRVDPDSPALDPEDLPHDTPIVVYCSVGYRSAAVADRLKAAGFTRVFNLEGGIFQWANEGRPIFRDREPAHEVHPYSRLWGRWLDSKLHPED